MGLKTIVFLLSVISAALGACPDGCECINTGMDTVAYCTPKSADQLHKQITALPTTVVELHIGDHGTSICNVGKELLSDTFQGAPEVLVNIYIEKCNLQSISATAFSGLKKLQNLFIIGNPITSLPNALLKDLVGLTGFTVEDCPLKALAPEVFTSAGCFRELVIAGTEITDLNTALASLKCLTNLNVSRNHLSEIKKSMFTAMLNLIYLDISYNMGVVLEGMVFNELTKLTELSMAGISHNAATLPGTILSGLPQLVYINVADNGFTDIAKLVLFLKDVLKIQYLDASENDLKALNNEDFVLLTELNTLHLAHSNIRMMESDSLRGLTNLDKLDLSGNAIVTLPGNAFIFSTKITELNLADNGINSISKNTFVYLTALKNLNLHGSSLPKLTKEMFPSNLATLVSLDLSNSTITSIDGDAFTSLTGLREINLDENHIHEIPKELLKSLADKGVHVDIRSNDWNCNCDMFLYREWMEENALNLSMICSEPEALRGKDVMNMPLKETYGCRAPSINECCHYNVTLNEGDEAVFKCSSSGEPAPTLSLSVLDGDPLPLNRTLISSDNSTIVVTDLEVGDSGNFSCTASNIWGHETTYYELTVMALSTTILPNTTTEFYNTTTEFYNTTTEWYNTTTEYSNNTTHFPGTSSASPSPAPTGAPYRMNGGIIGVIVVLVLILVVLIVVLSVWFIKRRRADDRRSLITNQGQGRDA